MDANSPPRRVTGSRTGLVVGRILGVPVRINAGVLLLAALVTVLYGEFAHRRLGLSPLAGYPVGLAFVVCLLGSVLLHELGHAVAARRYGIPVRGITLQLLGGYTEMERDAPSPRVDLVVSLAGPAVSLLLGAAAAGAAAALPDRTLPDQLAFQLAVSNLIVAVYNSLPGLPLDGGRALRAGVWAVTRDRHTATVVAGWAGRVLAVATAALAGLLTWLQLLRPLGLILLLLVAVTGWHGAGQSIRVARISRRFPLVDLARLARPVVPVISGTPLSEAQRRGDLAGGALAVSDSSGRLTALVDRAAAAAVPAARRPWVAVDSVARELTGVPRLAVELGGEEVVRAVQAYPGAQYLVTRGEDVVGVLHVADLAQLLEPTRKLTP